MTTSGRVPAVPFQSRIFRRTALLTCTFATHESTAFSRSYCATIWTEAVPALRSHRRRSTVVR
jgi:hypothetical protein